MIQKRKAQAQTREIMKGAPKCECHGVNLLECARLRSHGL